MSLLVAPILSLDKGQEMLLREYDFVVMIVSIIYINTFEISLYQSINYHVNLPTIYISLSYILSKLSCHSEEEVLATYLHGTKFQCLKSNVKKRLRCAAVLAVCTMHAVVALLTRKHCNSITQGF